MRSSWNYVYAKMRIAWKCVYCENGKLCVIAIERVNPRVINGWDNLSSDIVRAESINSFKTLLYAYMYVHIHIYIYNIIKWVHKLTIKNNEYSKCYIPRKGVSG